MSSKEHFGDNAVDENFFGSLKQERVQWANYQTRFEVKQEFLNYIAMFYYSHRSHYYLDYKSPNDYESELMKLLNENL